MVVMAHFLSVSSYPCLSILFTRVVLVVAGGFVYELVLPHVGWRKCDWSELNSVKIFDGGEKKIWVRDHLNLSFNPWGRWGTADDFTSSSLHFSLFSAALWDLANSRLVHSLMSSSHLSPFLPALSSSPFHCALQSGFGQIKEKKSQNHLLR